MGRWTVEEWRAAQAQQQHYSYFGELDMDADALRLSRAVLLDDDSNEFKDEDEDEKEDVHAHKYGECLPSPLPASPAVPPTPLPKAPTRPFVVAQPAPLPLPPPEGRVHKLLGVIHRVRTRGKRGKAAGTNIAIAAGEPERPPDHCQRAQRLRPDLEILVTPTRSLPRSPGGRRREFRVSPRSPGMRIVPKSKSKSKSRPHSKVVVGQADGYTYNGQRLQILVSTQTTATASAPDARRPRVFFPRSSSLAAARQKNRLPPSPPPPPPPLPPPPEMNVVHHPRALPALPQAPPSVPPVLGPRTRRIRPLPVPVRALL
ncbi:hypothetical protein B0H17DRAFT_1216693 [Mycena rosella]|uniref:Uncharacterized protein n=1 Tax=Mycena rosella TaxID=1033263 RepID=A0AAD7C6G6_MYCRO|nr:hypothetical protein B0H17DRAFT_1216693 [Mycena rosella]